MIRQATHQVHSFLLLGIGHRSLRSSHWRRPPAGSRRGKTTSLAGCALSDAALPGKDSLCPSCTSRRRTSTSTASSFSSCFTARPRHLTRLRGLTTGMVSIVVLPGRFLRWYRTTRSRRLFLVGKTYQSDSLRRRRTFGLFPRLGLREPVRSAANVSKRREKRKRKTHSISPQSHIALRFQCCKRLDKLRNIYYFDLHVLAHGIKSYTRIRCRKLHAKKRECFDVSFRILICCPTTNATASELSLMRESERASVRWHQGCHLYKKFCMNLHLVTLIRLSDV